MTQSTRSAMGEVGYTSAKLDYTMTEVGCTAADYSQGGDSYKKCSQFSGVIKKMGDQENRSISYGNETPELYDLKEKIVKKGRGARAVEWLSNHHPFKCCCGTTDDNSKFEMN